ncbi:hypothetical protein [Cupriavidus taiwanensis]|uniref:Lipoprotein n=1 Tax=Cupriavidus taiwanensis TaxID=164546 RepID=A0A375JBI1_9BURK|nr:hypothetical protein [Cupriavidus taiwanensis]SPS02249.1 exported hypothetical protein [Cupriavidus taiwanensis]
MFPHALAAARAAGLALLTAALLAACGSDDSPRRRPPSRRARAWWSHSIGLLFLLLMSPVGQAVAQTIYAIKPDPEIAAICAAEDGLTAMWAREPAPNKADIRFQYEGVKAQADAAAKAPPAEEEGRAPPIAPVPLTFEEYRDAVMAQRCKIARDGIVETFERAMNETTRAKIEAAGQCTVVYHGCGTCENGGALVEYFCGAGGGEPDYTRCESCD